MPNKYSYIGGNDLIGDRYYDEEMKKYDLNFDAIKTFACALKVGNLEDLEAQFKIINARQKTGLLNMELYYYDLKLTTEQPYPYGTPLALAGLIFKHDHIVKFLCRESITLNITANAFKTGATAGALVNKIPTVLGNHVSLFLNKKAGPLLALTRKDANGLAQESKAKIIGSKLA